MLARRPVDWWVCPSASASRGQSEQSGGDERVRERESERGNALRSAADKLAPSQSASCARASLPATGAVWPAGQVERAREGRGAANAQLSERGDEENKQE